MKVGIHVTNFTWPGGAERIGSRLAAVARAADMVLLMPVGPDPVGLVQRVGAEIVPRLAEL